MSSITRILENISRKEASKFWSSDLIPTPLPLVREIIGKLPVDWSNSKLRFADLACGRGMFLLVIIETLLEAGHSLDHIVEHMIYGVDIDKKNVDAAYAFIGQNKYKANITCVDALTWKPNMKFDVIVGNPPYQDSSTVVQGSRGNLWHKFVFLADGLLNDDGILAFVTPDSWLQFRGQLGRFLKNHQLTHVWTNSFTSKHFSGVGITTSAWILCKSPPSAPTHFVNEDHYVDLREKTMLANSSVAGTSILEKVLVAPSTGIQFQTDSENNVSWKNNETNKHKYAEAQTLERPYRICHTARIDCYAVNKPIDYDTKKVILPLMTGTPQPRYFDGGIGSISRMSVHYNVLDERQGMNLISLLKSKLYQFVCRVTNNRNSMTRDWLRQLPLLDLTHTWTNEDLYKHFNLTKEEIALVESTIK